jgi:hypothetical protein
MEFGSEIVGEVEGDQAASPKMGAVRMCTGGDDLAIDIRVGGTREKRHHGGFRGGFNTASGSSSSRR